MSIHPDLTAWRAVDACGGAYTPEQEASGYAQGHRDALDAATESAKAVDSLMSELLKALDDLTFTIGVTAIKHADQLPDLERAVVAGRAVINKATAVQTG